MFKFYTTSIKISQYYFSIIETINFRKNNKNKYIEFLNFIQHQ